MCSNCMVHSLQENPNPQPYAQKVARPPDGAHTRIHQPVFPKVDRHKIQEIIEEGMAKQGLKAKYVISFCYYIGTVGRVCGKKGRGR